MNARTRTLLAAALVLGIAAGPVATTAFAAPSTHSATAATQEYGPDAAALRKAIAGLPNSDATAALVRVGGKGSWHGSAGVHDIVTNRKAQENARFRAGSTTKVVTSAVVLQLVAEGKLSLDDTVQEYLPDLLSADFQPITVRQLLTFTSGLQSGKSFGGSVEEEYPHRFETLTPEEVVASSVAKGPYRGEGEGPGKKQRYANIDYTVLGMLIEKITGDSYEHQAQVRVFDPVGMRHTSFPGGPDPRIHGPHNRGYQVMGGKLVDVTEWNMSDRWAAGDMISTTADLEKFLFALFGGEVVPSAQLEEMFTVPDIDGATMSAGLSRIELSEDEVVWAKTGGRPGYNTVIAGTRDLSRTLVYSVNSTDAKGEAMNPVAERVVRAAFSR
ncbi:serine hydrolase domain-containing protein [Streptomyces sp. NBC_01304]|uniref:serine hydrolase domain-containing protein n=1 Tax=Streptomyces sp. NBC_01304 TaxID=2903818 RepID=UPI002E13B562|nr:beta-lactamase family protein [Streptomyces sp. NBC_01304]